MSTSRFDSLATNKAANTSNPAMDTANTKQASQSLLESSAARGPESASAEQAREQTTTDKREGSSSHSTPAAKKATKDKPLSSSPPPSEQASQDAPLLEESKEEIEAEDASVHPGDLITLLTDHHVQMRGLLNEIAATSGDLRRAAFAQLQRLLAVHDTAETVVVHPESRIALADGERVVAARLHEEEVTRVVMGTLSALDPDVPEFEATFDDFKKSLWKHMDAEERDEFPLLRETLPPLQLARLKARVEQAERIAPPLNDGAGDLLIGDQETRFEDISSTVRAVLMSGH